MDVLVIHDDARCRVGLAKALQESAHRVTLSSSVEEAQELLQFAMSSIEMPSVVLIAESLLNDHSSQFRQDLADRLDDLMWVPLRRDLEFRWLSRWLTRMEHGAHERARAGIEIVLMEPDRRMRDAATCIMETAGDHVVACGSLKEAEAALAELPATSRNCVLVAPVMSREGDTISLFLAAQRRNPHLRWVVQRPKAKPAIRALGRGRTANHMSNIDLMRPNLPEA
jgi:DNA-binding NtrC family response regulator